ncbi:MAG: tyrosine-type recombinase/integrase [Lentisphaeria bacterium]|nr:tyrosine-type recombinase/integrase [Lentisphaeria bacterium]
MTRTLDSLSRDFLDYRRSLNHSPATIRTFRTNIGYFLAWLERYYRVNTADRLRKAHLYAYQKHLDRHRTRRGLPLKPNSINSRVKAVKALLRWLHERNYVTTHLDRYLRYLKIPSFLPTSVLTHAQVRKEIGRIDTTHTIGYRDRTILELLYSTGIRAGELVGTQLPDVDLEHACATVTGKGNKQRIVPLGRTALRVLETYIKAVRPFTFKERVSQALFFNRRGRPLNQKNLNDMIAARSGSSKIAVHYTPHTFRRSCATELIRNNANPYHVKELLGHESIESLKPYTKLTIIDLKKTHAKCHPRERDEQRERG